MKPTSYNEVIKIVETSNWQNCYVFNDFNKITLTPEVVIWPCLSMAIPNAELFRSLSFVLEEQDISKLQT